MPKSLVTESYASTGSRYQRRLRVRSAALTAISVTLTEATDVVSACTAARSIATRLCFETAEIDQLAAALAACGGALVGVGGRGSALVSDASEPDCVVVRVSVDARVVSFGLIEAAVLRVAGPWRHRPALGLPRGAFHWEVGAATLDGGARLAFTLTRARGTSGVKSPFRRSDD